MAELHYADLRAPGIERKRSVRGFSYSGPGGRIDDSKTLDRIRALAIPPGWQDVWICASPLGHIQATGFDAARRRQYRYHDDWRACRDRMKFERMLEFARALPKLRATATGHLAGDALTRERVLGSAARLLDRGFFRIGSEEYAEENETYGLATMCRDQVKLLDGDRILFDYIAKAKKRRVQSVVDADVYRVVRQLKNRRGGGRELLAYRRGDRWCDVRSTDINDYIKQHTGAEFSAKDFRTWNATVLAAVGLAVSMEAAGSHGAHAKVTSRVVKEVARYLGNTPAVCRGSYIDPRIFERFDEGLTVGDALDLDGSGAQERLEECVIDLLEAGRTHRRSGDVTCAKAWAEPERRARLRAIVRCAA